MSEYQSYKQEVVHTCHTLLERGYLKATEGNISTRIKGQNAFAITPSHYDYAKMQEEDICVLDYEIKAQPETIHREQLACGRLPKPCRCALRDPHPPTLCKRVGIDQNADPCPLR